MVIHDRIERLRQAMYDAEVDAAIVLHPGNIHYLAAFKAITYTRPIILVVSPTREILIVPGLEEIHAHEAARVSEIRTYYEHPEKSVIASSGHDLLLNALDDLGRKSLRLGVESDVISHTLAQRLTGRGWSLADIGAVIFDMRQHKDADELALLRDAGRLARLGVIQSLDHVAAGQPVLEFEMVGSRAVIAEAARTLPGRLIGDFIVATAVGERAALPHLITPNIPIIEHALIIHNRQVGVDGYRAECERTFSLGALPVRAQDIFRVVAEAQAAAIDRIAPGVACSEIDRTARDLIRAAGYGDYFVHRTGHGLGLDVHEAPYLRWDNPAPLEPGMVVSVEPAVYVPGLGGARHSDTVVVTETGHELLTA